MNAPVKPLPAPLLATVAASDRHGHWGIQAIWDSLQHWLPELSIEVVDSIPSTNQALVDRIKSASRNAQGRESRGDDLSPSLLVAIQQTQGRGRLGRTWESMSGASLTFSLSLPIRRPDWSGLSLTVGVALAEVLDPSGIHIGLKWPNDLWLIDSPGRGRKLGGVLIEGVALGDQRVAVIGIGLNIQPMVLSEPVASLSELEPDARPPLTLARLMPALAEVLTAFEQDGFGALLDRYQRRDMLRGHGVRTTDPDCPEGMAQGVDLDGALRVTHAGLSHRIISGDVSVRPANPRQPD